MEGYTPPGRERDGYLSLERSQSCERTGRHAAQCHMFKDKSSQLKRPVYRCYARECHWKCQGRSCDIGSFLKAGRPRCHDLVIESKEFRRLMTGALPQFFFPFRLSGQRVGVTGLGMKTPSASEGIGGVRVSPLSSQFIPNWLLQQRWSVDRETTTGNVEFGQVVRRHFQVFVRLRIIIKWLGAD